jgi:hypothetical protein
MRIRRRNVAWLTILAALIGVVFLSGVASVQVMAVLAGVFIVALLASVLEVRPTALAENVRTSPLRRMRMSNEAREAADRAQRRGDYSPRDMTLIDIGLISAHTSPDGMVMRKSRTVSGDDDGVRPFITLHVEPRAADQHATIRFEIVDHNGDTQYIHEMRTYLRDGEMNILADHQLPLLTNEKIGQGGDWDLRVTVDGALVGILSFGVTPSLYQRERQLSQRSRLEEIYDNPADSKDDEPMSLEELMRSQQNRSRRTTNK